MSAIENKINNEHNRSMESIIHKELKDENCDNYGMSGLIRNLSSDKISSLFYTIFENSSTCFAILSFDYKILTVNQAFCNMFGLTSDKIVHSKLPDLLSGNDKETLVSDVDELFNSGSVTFINVYKFIHCNGSDIWGRLQFFPIGAKEGAPGIMIVQITDLTENIRSLEISEDKFSTIFTNSPLAMAISTKNEGVFVDANRQFYQLTGYTKAEVIGKKAAELNLISNRDKEGIAPKQLSDNEHFLNFQADVSSKSGKISTCLIAADEISIQNTEYVLGSALDITEVKKAGNRIGHLYQQQKLLADISRLLLETKEVEKILNEVLGMIGEHTGVSRVYIFEDRNGGETCSNTYEWCNTAISPQIENLQEIPYKEIPTWKETLIEQGRIFSTNITKLPPEIFTVLNEQGIKSILVYPLWIENSFYGFIGFDECLVNKDWEESEINLLKVVSNIVSATFERRNFIQKLENSELRLKMAVEGSYGGIWDWHNKTGHVYYSETYCNMLGYEIQEVIPDITSWEKLVHPDDIKAVTDILERHLKGETEYYESSHRLLTKEGTWKWILDRGKVYLRDEQNHPLRTIGLHIDISKQKEVEQRFHELNDTKDKIFSVISHELRNSVSNFPAILEFLSVDENLQQKNQKRILKGLKKAADNTFYLLENLLNWSRSQTHTIHVKPTHFLINPLINDNVGLLNSRAADKSITIELNTQTNIAVLADRDAIHLILRNLISNAIKFTSENGKISITCYENNDKAFFEIADNGIGISPDILSVLFNSTTFLTTYGTKFEKGSGIGLKLCKEFVERNEGTITAESSPGKGSRFIVSLKKGILPEENETTPEKNNNLFNKGMLEGKTILLVDDDDFNLFLIKETLLPWKVNVLTSENGKDALASLVNNKVDVVLMDLEMPVINGYEAALAIRTDLCQVVPIIAISANVGDKYYQKAKTSGMNDFMVKPLDPEELYEKVIRLLGLENKTADNESGLMGNRPLKPNYYDPARLNKMFNNDQQKISKMINHFLAITPEYFNNIKVAWEEKDFISLKEVSHKIKSSINLLATQELIDNINLIHELAEDGANSEKLNPLIYFFFETYPELCNQLREQPFMTS